MYGGRVLPLGHKNITLMRYLFFLCLSTACLLQCQSNATSEANQAEETATATTTENTGEAVYPSISTETMRMLWDNCDYIDFVFYNTNFSMSQNQQPAIRTTISGVSTTPALIKPTCQAAGRIFFQVDGANALEADIYLGPDCFYYVFLENGEYAYANFMTEQGRGFYDNIFSQIQQATGQ